MKQTTNVFVKPMPINRLADVMIAMALMVTMLVASIPAALAKTVPSEGFADLVDKLSPAVVNIRVVKTVEDDRRNRRVNPFRDFFNVPDQNREEDDEDENRRQEGSLGTGFFIDGEGHIVTNNHVIGEGEDMEITVTLPSGKEYDAKLVGRDEELDIVLLKVETSDKLNFVPFGDSDAMRVGDWIVAIGNPFGLGGSVTAGIVSGRNRDVGGPLSNFIQTDASINRGNSGGPMFNLKGEVVGVNNMILSPTGGNVGIGFAIPSNMVKRSVAQLKEFGRTRRGWIGVSILPVSKELAESFGMEEAKGAYVTSVVPGGPADASGMKVDDIILMFDGHEVTNNSELVRVVSATPVGETVRVRVFRQGNVETLRLETKEREANLNAQAEMESGAPSGDKSSQSEEVLDMTLVPMSDMLRQRFDVPSDVNGVLITRIKRISDVARRGLRVGDVIMQVNTANVESVDDVHTAIQEALDAGRSAVRLRINRRGTSTVFAIPLDDYKK